MENKINKKFLIPLGDTSDLNLILIKSIQKTFDPKNVLDHLVEDMAAGNAVKIYNQTKSYLAQSIFVLMPKIEINVFYANLNNITDISKVTANNILELKDVVSFDDLMNKRTDYFLQTFNS